MCIIYKCGCRFYSLGSLGNPVSALILNKFKIDNLCEKLLNI